MTTTQDMELLKEYLRQRGTSEGTVSIDHVDAILCSLHMRLTQEQLGKLVKPFTYGTKGEIYYESFLNWLVLPATSGVDNKRSGIGTAPSSQGGSPWQSERHENDVDKLVFYYEQMSPEFKELAMEKMRRLRNRAKKSYIYNHLCTEAHREKVRCCISACSVTNGAAELDLKEFQTLYDAVRAVHSMMVEHGARQIDIDDDFREEFKRANIDETNAIEKDELMIWLYRNSRGAKVLLSTPDAEHAREAPALEDYDIDADDLHIDSVELDIFLEKVVLVSRATEEISKYQMASELQRTVEQYDAAFQRLRSASDYDPPTSFQVELEPPLQPAGLNTVDDLLQHGSKIKSEVESIGENMCYEINASFWSMGPTKNRRRSAEKIEHDYGGNVRRLLDVIRFSMVCEDMYVLHKAIAYLRSLDNVEIIRIKSGFDPKNRHRAVSGAYRDVKLNCKHLPSGHLFEVQLHLLVFYSIKQEAGHHVYQWSRQFAIQGIVSAEDVIACVSFAVVEQMSRIAQDNLRRVLKNRGNRSLKATQCRLAVAAVAQLTCEVALAEKCLQAVLLQVATEGLPATSERGIGEIYLLAGKNYGSCFSKEEALSFLEKGRQYIENISEAEREFTDRLFLARCDFEVGCWYFGSDTAVRSFKKADDVFQEILGENHPQTLKTTKAYAACISKMNRVPEAIPLLKKCEDLGLKALGDEHRLISEIFLELGWCYEQSQSWSEALKYYSQCATIRRKLWGEEHPRTGTCYMFMGSCYLQSGEPNEGREALQRAIHIFDLYLLKHTDETAKEVINAIRSQRKCTELLEIPPKKA